MNVDCLLARFSSNQDREAIIHAGSAHTYGELCREVGKWRTALRDKQVEAGTVVAVTGDYSLTTMALILALIANKNIIVPLTALAEPAFADYFSLASVRLRIDFLEGEGRFESLPGEPSDNPLLTGLVEAGDPGLILFTSGSTGRPKGVVHNLSRLTRKFENASKSLRILGFLLFDHIAGIDTYFYSLFSGGTIVFPESRGPDDICRLIEAHQVEVLPVSPTFLNLLVLSGAHRNYDLSCLRIITFGSERMPAPLLDRLKREFPAVKLIQKYGVTELGSPQSKSHPEDSAWIKIDSERFKTKVENGRLFVKADTAMLGYLNAPSPFTADGWYDTGDQVEVRGEYVRILGRESELINVGGEKVYPVEVEEVILAVPGVEDVAVKAVASPITGQMIQATVKLAVTEKRGDFRKRMRLFCQGRLPDFKIPQKVILTDEAFHGGRFKKMR